MPENILLDGRVFTRDLLAKRTLGWGTSFPVRSQYKDGELFIRTDLKTIYKYNLTNQLWNDLILDEDINVGFILAYS